MSYIINFPFCYHHNNTVPLHNKVNVSYIIIIINRIIIKCILIIFLSLRMDGMSPKREFILKKNFIRLRQVLGTDLYPQYGSVKTQHTHTCARIAASAFVSV